MNENTLLSLITGGKYQTSADLPTFRETAHSFMDDLMQKQDAEMSEVLYPAGKNIFGQTTEPVTQEDLLSLVMGTLGPGEGMPKLSHPSKIPHYIDSVYDQGNLVAKKLKNIKWH